MNFRGVELGDVHSGGGCQNASQGVMSIHQEVVGGTCTRGMLPVDTVLLSVQEGRRVGGLGKPGYLVKACGGQFVGPGTALGPTPWGAGLGRCA